MLNTSYLERLSVVLKEKNITEAALVKQLGISVSTFSDWRKQKSKPSLETMTKIAEYLDVSLDWIVTGKTKESPSLSIADDEFIIKCASLSQINKIKVSAYIDGLGAK